MLLHVSVGQTIVRHLKYMTLIPQNNMHIYKHTHTHTHTHIYIYIYIYNYREQSPPWEANSLSASPENPHILWNSEVYYRIRKSPPTVPILNQLNPVHSLHFLNIHFNIILPSTPGYSQWSVRQVFPPVPCMNPSSPHTYYVPHPSNYSWFDHPKNIWWGVQIIKLLLM